jgi:anthranilate/para-aminobenzoate synthase component II
MPITLPLSMSDKIFIVDFDDSFTYNIASVLFPFESHLSVVSHRDFFPKISQKIAQEKNRCAVILGPGPGHPSEFNTYFKAIEKLRGCPHVFIMGICLGHQILGLIDGKEVHEALEKKHGQTVEIEWRGQKRVVQRYNSLSVYEKGVELVIREFSRGLSYQFHPESIGTDSNEVFFMDLLEFIRKD